MNIPYLLRLNHGHTAAFRFAGAVVAVAFEYRSAWTARTSGRVEMFEVVNSKAVSNVGILVGCAMTYALF